MTQLLSYLITQRDSCTITIISDFDSFLGPLSLDLLSRYFLTFVTVTDP